MLKTFLIRTEILHIEDITGGDTIFICKCKIKTNFLEYCKVVSALKLFRQKCSQQPNGATQTQGLWANIIKSIIEKKATTPLKSRGKCLSKENMIGNANVNKCSNSCSFTDE